MNFLYWTRLPALVAFAGIALGIFAARIISAAFTNSQLFLDNAQLVIYIFIATIIITIIFGILTRSSVLRFALFAICGFALLTQSNAKLNKFYNTMETISEHKQIFTLQTRITSPVAFVNSTYRFRGEIVGTDAGDTLLAQTLLGRTLQFTSREQMPPYGTITVQGQYAPPRSAASAVSYDQREHYAVNNIFGNFRVSRIVESENAISSLAHLQKINFDGVSHRVRMVVHSVINRASSDDARAVFHAAFLGEREHLSRDLNITFRRAGIVHLLAISGFHAALLFGAIYAALGLFALPQKSKTLIALAMLWCYLLFIGFIPSLFRATMMVTFFCVTQLASRKSHPMHSLGAAGAAWLMLSPHSLFAPGFQLSFAATAGIIMLQPVLKTITDNITSASHNEVFIFITEKFTLPLWVSVAGFVATAPPLLHHFGVISLYGIFFNLIAIPLMSVAMWIFFGSLILFPIPFVSGVAVLCAEKIMDALIALASFANTVPLSEVAFARISPLQLFIAVIFMIGLCAVQPALRAAYALRAGALSMVLIAAIAIWSSFTATTEEINFVSDNATINVIIHPNNTAWIHASGNRADIRRLRVREVEPLLQRRRVREVPLFLINIESESEAHAFVFENDYSPRIIVLTNEQNRAFNPRNISERYTIIDVEKIISADGFEIEVR